MLLRQNKTYDCCILTDLNLIYREKDNIIFIKHIKIIALYPTSEF